MSVGEWLNTVIQPADQEDDEAWWAADFDREPAERRESRPRDADRERDRERGEPPRQRFYEDRGRERDEPPRQRLYEDRDRERDEPPRQSLYEGRDRERTERPQRHSEHRERAARDQRRTRHDYEQEDRRDRPANRRRDDRRSEEQPRQGFRDDDRGQRPQGAPYRDEPQRADRPRREWDRYRGIVAAAPADDQRGVSIDKAIAEITARQRTLDGDISAEISERERALNGETAAEPSLAGPPQPPVFAPPPEEMRATAPQAAKMQSRAEPVLDIGGLQEQLRQITSRIEALRPSGDLETAINGLRADLAEIGRSFTEALPRRALESLEIEIKALAERIDHSRLFGADSTALAAIERSLAELREALRGLTPAEGLVGLDEAVKALANKVDSVIAKDDPAVLQQLESAIDALRGIVSHVASNDTLTRVADDVRALSAKVDGIAKSAAGTPTLAALENRIDVLAGALSAKVDCIASTTANAPTLAALENRIDVLAGALNASTEAGHAVPRELEKLLSGLIEKLEWVQLTHTDHTALAHLEDRIAALVKRLDASDARFGLLEGVERGLSDLLVYIEQLRSSNGAAGVAKAPVAAAAIEHQVAEIKQTGRRTRGSLEDMQGTVEHVVDRLATIESDMRVDRAKPAPVEVLPTVEPQTLAPSEHPPEPAAMSLASIEPDIAPRSSQFEPPSQRLAALAAARTPIDPSLPPDHPLEPGSAGRSRNPPPAADRIAASEAVVGSKPPVIPDPGGGKPDFIAAARRAAQAAAAGSPYDKASVKVGAATGAPPKKRTERLRTIIVAAAVVVIVVGGFHIISRLFEDGTGAPTPAQTEPPHVTTPQLQTEPPRTRTETPHVQPEPAPAPARKEPPHVEAEPLPPVRDMQGANSVSTPMSVPSADAAQSPSRSSPPDDGKTQVHGAAQAPVAAAPTDITGSLAGASAPHSPAATPMGGDKLPLAIGGPALRLAALAGDPAAAYEVAVRFAEGRAVPANNQEAVRWFDIAARKGLAPAQFRLGTFYEKGLGVKKDLAAARDLYRAAADKGHGKAMHNLAVLYAEGIDGKADYRAAAQWFRKAADYGITDSQYNLAILYARGVGVEQNLAESYKWFFLAAKEGDQDAAHKRDEIASRLDKEALAAARLAAEKWTPLPQPADAVTVKGAWDAPTKGTSSVKAKSRSAKALAPDGTTVN